MRRTLIVAHTEFLKYITRRGFIISLLMFPLWLAAGALVPQWIERATPTRVFTVIDRTGGDYAAALRHAVRNDNGTRTLSALAAYATAHVDMAAMRKAAPKAAALLDAPDGDTHALVVFRRAGGASALVRALEPYRAAGAPAFSAPRPRFLLAPAPEDLRQARAGTFARSAGETLSSGLFYAIVVIPKGFSPAPGTPEAEYWSADAPDAELQHFVQTALSDALQREALRKVAPGILPEALQPSAHLRPYNASGGGHQASVADQLRLFAPAALAFVLLLTIFMNAGALLSGVIEEKSSRIVEVILSCVTPTEFMTGKLLGAAGASLLTLVLWMTILALGAAMFVPGSLQTIGTVVLGIATGGLLPMLLLCFLCGLLIYASIFLAIGSMATSIQDAQALVGPTMIVVMAPLIMMPALLHDPNGAIATLMTWIPVYTPFFLMFRLPWHPPAAQVWGAIILMIVTAVVMAVQMGRVFAAHVLTAERPPRLAALLRRLFVRTPQT